MGILILLVFMDTQARKHFQSIQETGVSAERELSPVVQEGKKILSPVLTPDEVQFEKDYNESMDARLSRANSESSLQDPDSQKNLQSANAPVAPEKVDLYYIRFQGKNSVLVRVSRKYNGEVLDYREVLNLLKNGPELSHRGLLNAFDSRMEVHSVTLRDGIAYVDLNEAISRMNARIIKDRIDQMLFTLFQFESIKGVRLFVNGRSVSSLGSEGVRVPEILGRPDRPTYPYKDSQ